MRVLIYSKPGCTLCDKAEVIISEICHELGEGYEVIDISVDPKLMKEYGEQIPVVFVDGKQHDFWTVNPDRLRKALA